MMYQRRHVLKLLGATGFGAFAGCSGGGDTADGTETTQAPSGTTSTEQVGKIAPTDDSNGDFGHSISVSPDGSTALVGAPAESQDGDGAGKAYVFSRTDGTWSQQAKLTPDGADVDSFGLGASISRDGSTAIVTAPHEDNANGNAAGTGYVFARGSDGWTRQTTLTADDGDQGDGLGFAVELADDGTAAVLGAINDEDPNGEAAGSAYVFSQTGGAWSQQAKVTPADGEASDRFGKAVGLSNDGSTVIVGAMQDDNENGNQAGTAYVFSQTDGSWSQRAKLVADDGNQGDGFGYAVGLSGDGSTAIVGAWQDEEPNGTRSGSSYVFSQAGDTWTQQTKLTAGDGNENDFFGSTVGLSRDGSTVVVGAPRDEDPNGPFGGSAYVFSRTDGSWSQRTKLVAGDGEEDDLFGSAVSASDDGSVVLVGAPGDGAGSGYVFTLE